MLFTDGASEQAGRAGNTAAAAKNPGHTNKNKYHKQAENTELSGLHHFSVFAAALRSV